MTANYPFTHKVQIQLPVFEHKEGLQLGHIQLQKHHNPSLLCL